MATAGSAITWEPVRVKLGDLKPWAHNPRQSTKKQAQRILASFGEFGQVQTVAVDPHNEVLDGHQRLSALLTIHGKGYEVDARRASRALTDAERKRLVLMLNAGATGEWDWDALSSFDTALLQDGGMDKDLLAQMNRDTAALIALLEEADGNAVEDADVDIDEAAQLREKWQTAFGQLWECGTHKMLCGDSTSTDDVARLMTGEVATLAPVDPPYNVGFNYDGETVDDKKDDEAYEHFSRAWFEVCQSVSDRQIVTPGGVNIVQWFRWFDSHHVGAWTKTNAMTRGRVSNSWCWEPVFFFGAKWQKRRANDVFNYPISNQTGTANHPCPKPLKMWADLLENYSEKGDVIYEAFGGSGTTLIACEQLGRKCRAIEISPDYVAVALERWSQATGKTPVLLDELDTHKNE
jgi:DNA modification methylase